MIWLVNIFIFPELTYMPTCLSSLSLKTKETIKINAYRYIAVSCSNSNTVVLSKSQVL